MFRNVVQNDWITALIVLSIALVAFAKLINPKRFYDFVNVLFNSNYLKIYIKEQRFVNAFDSVLFFNLIVSLSVFVVLCLRFFYGQEDYESLDFYYKLLVGLGSVILIKVFVDRLIGSLFEIDDIMNFYLFQKITFKNFIGLILLPLNILLVFAFSPSKTMLYIVLAILVLINLIGFVMSLSNNLKVLKNNFFYFILYLCALEIAPYLILFRVLDK